MKSNSDRPRPYARRAKPEGENMLQEARAVYGDPVMDQRPPLEIVTGITVTRLSTKNQITVPVAYVRALDLQPGDELQLSVIGEMLVGQRRPQTAEEWDAQMRGAVAYPEWDSTEKIDAWVRDERASWDREWDHNESS